VPTGLCACWFRARNLAGDENVLSQIAAQLSVCLRKVSVAQADTLEVPNSGPTVASRTVMVVGKLVQSAALGIKQTLISSKLLKDDYTAGEFSVACQEYVVTHGQFRSWSRYEPPADVSGTMKISRRSLCCICLGGLCRCSYG